MSSNSASVTVGQVSRMDSTIIALVAGMVSPFGCGIVTENVSLVSLTFAIFVLLLYKFVQLKNVERLPTLLLKPRRRSVQLSRVCNSPANVKELTLPVFTKAAVLVLLKARLHTFTRLVPASCFGNFRCPRSCGDNPLFHQGHMVSDGDELERIMHLFVHECGINPDSINALEVQPCTELIALHLRTAIPAFHVLRCEVTINAVEAGSLMLNHKSLVVQLNYLIQPSNIPVIFHPWHWHSEGLFDSKDFRTLQRWPALFGVVPVHFLGNHRIARAKVFHFH